MIDFHMISSPIIEVVEDIIDITEKFFKKKGMLRNCLKNKKAAQQSYVFT